MFNLLSVTPCIVFMSWFLNSAVFLDVSGHTNVQGTATPMTQAFVLTLSESTYTILCKRTPPLTTQRTTYNVDGAT